MLILPLHQPLTRQNFPWVTALLVLVNVFVFVVLQSGDPGAQQRAHAYYQGSPLAEIEPPLYARHLEQSDQHPLHEQLQAMPEAYRAPAQQQWMQQDPGFRARLAAGELFDDPYEFARWQPIAAEYQALRDRVFTTRFAFNADPPRALQLLSHMFLHGGVDHLLGNMLFLIALGLLVEGPLGAGLFAALYLTAGAGAGLAWLGWHGDGPGSLIGASGAIAGLMGAFCVLWGRRQVRFFYWFFVVFDYVRAPALLLLPLWLGWEVLQMWLSGGSRVAYSAHAGGIVAGASLALLVRQANWHREAYFEANDPEAPDADALYRQALERLGRMQLVEAGLLLDQAAALAPANFDIRLAQYRCARNGGDASRVQQSAATLLELPPAPAAQTRELAAAVGELSDTAWQALPAAALSQLGLRLAAIREPGAAVALFDRLQRVGNQRELAQGWLQLAFRLRDVGEPAAMRQALQRLAEHHPDSGQAAKARFLLEAEGSV